MRGARRRPVDLPLRRAPAAAGGPEPAHPRDRRDPGALRVSPDPRAPAARGLAGEREADLPALHRRRPATASQDAQAPGRGEAPRGPFSARGAERGVGDELPLGPAVQRAQDPDPHHRRRLHSRLSPAIDVRPSYRGTDGVETLERVTAMHGTPKTIRLDNGPEFISKALDLWAWLNGVTLDFSRPGSPPTTPSSSRSGPSA